MTLFIRWPRNTILGISSPRPAPLLNLSSLFQLSKQWFPRPLRHANDTNRSGIACALRHGYSNPREIRYPYGETIPLGVWRISVFETAKGYAEIVTNDIRCGAESENERVVQDSCVRVSFLSENSKNRAENPLKMPYFDQKLSKIH